MSSQDKAPKKKNPQKITDTSDKKEDKKIKKTIEEQSIPKKAEREDQKMNWVIKKVSKTSR